MGKPENQDLLIPLEGDSFHFNCHKDIPCFTECCSKLHLILTPYDILRIKNRIGMNSDEFLSVYTETSFKENSRFPMVLLRMDKEGERKCPFVTEDGCTIYEDRPGACRIYPIARASTVITGSRDAKEKFFIVSESHCLGFQEKKVWSLKEWLNHEGMSEYNAMNDKWSEIITSHKSMGTAEHVTKKLQMFFMASYNLDKFRKFVFSTNFFSLFDVPSDTRKKIETDDVSLMLFAFDWLKFSLFGEKTIKVKNAG